MKRVWSVKGIKVLHKQMKRCDFIDITASPTAGIKMDVRLNVTTARGFLNTMKTYDDGCLLHWRAKIKYVVF